MDRLRLPQNYLVFGLPLLMISAMVVLSMTATFKENVELFSIGVSFDLLITIPLVYFLLIRKTRIPKTTLVPLLVFSLIIGKYIIPGEHHYYLDLFKIWGLPVIEIFVLGFVILKVHKAIKQFNLNKENETDFYSILKKSCNELFPKPFVVPVVTEIAVFYYGFLYWKKRPIRTNEFLYHKESGSVSLLAVLIFLIIIETIVLHILLAMWSNTFAWLLSLLSAYSLIQIFGFMRSMSKRPVIIGQNKLYLRYGIMSEAVVKIEDIKAIEISSKDIELNSETRKLSFLGSLESHNLVLYLKRENTLYGLYGRKSTFKTLLLHIDEKHKFKEQIEVSVNFNAE
ncbi:hypothetical protein [Christiangramia sabulilitoris]|uniref:PH domain-containing protein n=1 Tax=Christiangramia sabulilitoris TaxID=2583991 RepID=A0A550I063_9FLAO|nr:hypothetical protein [Christiangramia sabulilitoris]TRO64372.1 hypothetical protein FGM01_12845 [Christiangramia sabulilitoris]